MLVVVVVVVVLLLVALVGGSLPAFAEAFAVTKDNRIASMTSISSKSTFANVS